MKTVERRQITPELVAHLPRPGTAIPGNIQYSPDSRFITYLFSERGDLFRELWRIDLSTGVKARWLTPPGKPVTEETVSREEALRRERMRQLQTGITDYFWAEKTNVLHMPLRGELYRWADGKITHLTGNGVIDPKITRDGRQLFFVRDGDVWTIDERGERRLTVHPPGTTNGLAEFVAQEELHRMSGYWPAADGHLVAFEQLDESHIPVYPIVHQAKPAVEIEEHRYPFAGAANARVKLGVIPAAGGRATFMDLGVEDGYIARVHWHPDGRLFVQWLSRDWRRLEILAYDVASGGGRAIVVEEQEPWINLHDDLRFVQTSGEFVWSSERTGFRHLYLYAPDGTLIRPLTEGDWPAEATVALDEPRRVLYFVGWQESPLERHLFRISLDGGRPERLTSHPGVHGAVIAPDFASFVDVWDNRATPPSVTVRSIEGEERWVIQPAADIDLDLTPPELHRFRASDGTDLYASLYLSPQVQKVRADGFPPPGPREAREGAGAPVIIEVYGGPSVQLVQDSWAETVDLRAQLLAQHGFVVMKLDNRGSARRGLQFEAPIAGNLGDIELRDQLEGIRWLKTLGFADTSRVGIYGWSYGGYMTLLALLRAPDVFKAGVAGAPVSFWEGYDTAYTEKYMRTPQANPDGYHGSAALTYADRLAAPLLLIHGMLDENVHFRHTARMMQALIDAGKPYETIIYPNERHGPRSERDRADMERRILEFFQRNV